MLSIFPCPNNSYTACRLLVWRQMTVALVRRSEKHGFSPMLPIRWEPAGRITASLSADLDRKRPPKRNSRAFISGCDIILIASRVWKPIPHRGVEHEIGEPK
jgi:hypothetical protein